MARPPRRATGAAVRAAAVLVLVVAVSVLAGAPAWTGVARAQGGAEAAREGDLPLDRIAVGDRGYGLTEGPDGPERFEVEVLAVSEPAGPGFPLLLVRTSGPFLDAVGGVAAGMSGSPIRLGPPGEERLAGALAYAFAGSDHRLALVTPIAAMRALSGEALPPGATPDGAAPLATPLLLTGVGPRAAAHLRPAFERAGLEVRPMQGGVGGATDLPDDGVPLTPGAAVAVALARGDVGIAAVGTVTDVRGDDVLLLGHPLLRAGAVAHALVPADVIAVVPDRELPYKLANVGGAPLGAVVRDGQAGLAARLDLAPDGLPVTVRVDAPGGARTFTARIAPDPRLAPALLAAIVHQAVDAVRDRVGGGAAELAWEIAFRDGPAIRLEDQRVDADDLAWEAARLAAAPLAVLMDNPFREPGLERLSVRIAVDETPVRAEIVEVALEAPEVAPGGTVRAFVRVQPWRGEAEVRTVAFDVPEDAEPGPLRLTFRGASVPDDEADEAAPGEAPDPVRQAISPLPPVISWGELLAALENRAQAREMLVEVPGTTRPRRLAREDLGRVVTGLERVVVTVVAPDEGAP